MVSFVGDSELESRGLGASSVNSLEVDNSVVFCSSC
jgi:hypothetical protein